MSETPDLLTTAQAAERLGISPATLTYWRTKRIGPRYSRLTGTMQGTVRYRVADLDAFVAAKVVEPAKS